MMISPRQELMVALKQVVLWEQTVKFCPTCQEALPLFVTDELAGKLVDDLYPDIAYHLGNCLVCQLEYEVLSNLMLNALYDKKTPAA